MQFDKFAIASDESAREEPSHEPELYWAVDDPQAAFDELSKTAEVSTPLRDMPFGGCLRCGTPTGNRGI